MEYHIYALVDPRDNTPFYVGCTKNLKQRYSSHMKTYAASNSYKVERIQEIKLAGQKPLMVCLETIECSELNEANRYESLWIATLSHFCLSNMVMTDRTAWGNFPSPINPNLALRTRQLNRDYEYYLDGMQHSFGRDTQDVDGFGCSVLKCRRDEWRLVRLAFEENLRYAEEFLRKMNENKTDG